MITLYNFLMFLFSKILEHLDLAAEENPVETSEVIVDKSKVSPFCGKLFEGLPLV